MSAPEAAARPVAEDALTQVILDLVQQAGHYRQLKKGISESIKTLCEDKNVPYVFVPGQMALGPTCGVSSPVVAASITTNDGGDLAAQIRILKARIERLMV